MIAGTLSRIRRNLDKVNDDCEVRHEILVFEVD